MAKGHRGRPPKPEHLRFQTLALTFRPDHIALLEELALKQGVSLSEVVRELLDEKQQTAHREAAELALEIERLEGALLC